MTDSNRPDQNERQASDARREFPLLNEERYRPMVDEMEMTDEQADEFLRVLWWIMCGFVDLGFGASSSQRVVDNIFKKFSEAASNDVNLEHPKNRTSALQPGGDDEARH